MAPTGVAAVRAEAVEAQLVSDDIGEGLGVAGQPDGVLAELWAALVEEGFEPTRLVEQVGSGAVETPPFLHRVEWASYGEYPVTIRADGTGLPSGRAVVAISL